MLPVERWFGSALRCGINWRSSDASERVARVFAPSTGSSGCLYHGGGRPGATHSWLFNPKRSSQLIAPAAGKQFARKVEQRCAAPAVAVVAVNRTDEPR